MKSIVITGVSSGIGYAAAEEFVRRGYRVFGSVRNVEDGVRMAAALGERFSALLFDVTDAPAIARAATQVEEALSPFAAGENGLTGLINNAGISIGGPAMHLPVDAFRRQFEVNLFGVIRVTQAFLPLLGARHDSPHPPGRIVNISSVSGKIAYPFLAPYAASKYALEAFSDSLRRELMLYGVDVIVVEPGAVKTPIWEKAQQQFLAYDDETDYDSHLVHMQHITAKSERTAMPVAQVTKVLIKAIEERSPRARYALPNGRVTGWWLPRFAPTRWFDRRIAKRLNLQPKWKW